MNQYLHLRCGPYQFLLASKAVLEIGECPSIAVSAPAGHRPWRGHSLPVLALPALLGVPACERGQQIVVRAPDEGLTLLEVDVVERLLELAPSRFVAILEISKPLARLVDGVALDGATCLLRLRYPFAWEASTNPAAMEDAHAC